MTTGAVAALGFEVPRAFTAWTRAVYALPGRSQVNVALRLSGSSTVIRWPSLRASSYPVTGEPPVSTGADQATVRLVPDEVTDTASGTAGTVLGFVVSAAIARRRASYRVVRVASVAVPSATAVFAAASALVNAFHEVSV